MTKPDGTHTKAGCDKPLSGLRTSLAVLTMAALLTVCAVAPVFPHQTAAAEKLQPADGLASPSGPLPYKPGVVLVRFASSGVAESIAGFLERAGLVTSVEEVLEKGGELLARMELAAGVTVEGAASVLNRLAGVLYAEPNHVVQASYSPADPDFPEQWGLENTGQDIGGTGTPGADISAPGAWDVEKGYVNPVAVAVIDTGTDTSHPDLDGKIWDNGDETAGDGDDDDDNGYYDDTAGYNWAGISQGRYYYYNYTEGSYYVTRRYFGYSGSGVTTNLRAQSLTGTGQDLTHVGLQLQKVDDNEPANGVPQDITVSVRETLSGADVASFVIAPQDVTTLPYGSEVYGELSAPVRLEVGTPYYLIVETPTNSTSDYYYLYDNWGLDDPADPDDTDQHDCYREGQEYRWDGSSWLSAGYEYDDLYFHTNPNAASHDDNGHGTHVSGIVGAEEGNGQGGVGVSFGAGIMPLKALDCSGSGYDDDIAAAIYYAADNGARVINMSLGGTASSQTMQDAVDYAHAAGVVVLAASGNSGNSTMQYPAGYDNVIGVGATTNTDEAASFSTFNSSVDVSAPGRYIYSTMPTYPAALNSRGYAEDYDYLSGTSMATPMAAGLAALIASYRPGYSPQQVELAMEIYAADLGAPGRDDHFGYGRIDALASLLGTNAPAITALAPTGGTIGSKVTVSGTTFGSVRGESLVSFGGVPAAAYDSWSDSVIVCTVPPGISGRVEVAVQTPLGTSDSRTFGVKAVVEEVSPDEGSVGSKVTVSGSAFGPSRGSSFAAFGGVPAVIYDSWSDTSISCYVPPDVAGEVVVTVTTSGGSAGGVPFTVTTPATAWYLAEGSTAGGMETFILVQNPGGVPAEVTLSFMTDGGPRPGP
ncbi:MAG: S8 family serine peptidase, partial [Actinomycetota bacterium]